MDFETAASKELEGHKLKILHVKFVNGNVEHFKYTEARELHDGCVILTLAEVGEKTLVININNILYYWITEKGD